MQRIGRVVKQVVEMHSVKNDRLRVFGTIPVVPHKAVAEVSE